MKRLFATALTCLTLSAPLALAQDLIDKGFVHGWNLMVDPALGNGCLIQTVYQDLSVVRLGYDGLNNRGYFTVFNKNWGDIKQGQSYPVTFDLDGKKFDATAIGANSGKVRGATVFFTDRSFVNSIAQRKVMTVYGTTGQQVMAIDLKGTDKALEYARECQKEQGH